MIENGGRIVTITHKEMDKIMVSKNRYGRFIALSPQLGVWIAVQSRSTGFVHEFFSEYLDAINWLER